MLYNNQKINNMKYMGSKRRIAKEILPIILKDRKEGQYYVEPFCGGCNMLQHVDGNRIANDNNKYLISMFESLTLGCEYDKIITREHYIDVRDSYRNSDGRYSDSYIGWIGFMGSFNGRFFDGGYSGSNVNGRDYIDEQVRNTISQLEQLKGVTWISIDYKELIIPQKSIIYCDPPYRGTKKYSTSKGFNHSDFWQWCRKMRGMGHDVFVSEYNAPDDFRCIWEKEIKDTMATHGTTQKVERLFKL